MALKREITAEIKELLGKNPKGLSITQIVRKIAINRNTAGRYLENLMVSGQVEMRQYGMAKIYRLAQRVPLSAMLSISSELIMLLDNSLRIIYANEPMYRFLGTTQVDLYGKNIEFSPCVTVCEDAFEMLKKHIRAGLTGMEWRGELSLAEKGVIFSCRIAPAVFEEGQRGVSVLLEDITERKRADEELRESEDRYRKLVEISPDAVILHREGRILYMNPAAFDLVGASHPRDMIGKNVLDFIHPGFRESVQENIQRDIGGDSTPPMELRMIRLDGTSVIVEGRGVRTAFEGEPAIQVALRDITERKRAEEAVRESEATARALLNAPTDSVILLDAEGIILDLNETAAKRMGKRKDELIGVLADNPLPDDLARARRSIIRKVLDTKRSVRFEDEREGMWFDTVAYPVIGSDGTVTRIAVIARDITVRKNIEKTLKESEERYRSLAEVSQDLIFTIDRDDVVTYINRAAAALLRRDPPAVIGTKRASLFPPELEKRQALGLRRVFESGQPVRSDGALQVKGKVRWFDHFLMPVRDSAGQVISVLGVSRDITDRKRIEEKENRT
jgi:PAS domain S-box-containing protein